MPIAKKSKRVTITLNEYELKMIKNRYKREINAKLIKALIMNALMQR